MNQLHNPKANNRSPSRNDLPIPKQGVIVTQLLIVRDLEKSRRFYEQILEAHVVMEGPPTILRFQNSWLILSAEGAPTDDRPGITALAPRDGAAFSSALNLRVSDINDVYQRWRSLGAHFLTPPKEHHSEIRCYLRDPDGHLIEVGQAKQRDGAR
jgi:catechol 2,3-dioxygenase-like lactoylglutathione lyase family enzyme